MLDYGDATEYPYYKRSSLVQVLDQATAAVQHYGGAA